MLIDLTLSGKLCGVLLITPAFLAGALIDSTLFRVRHECNGKSG